MKIGIIGLGKMGGPIAKKLKAMDSELVVYDNNPAVLQEYANEGYALAKSISDLSARSNVIWVMVPPTMIDSILENLCTCTEQNTIIIDGDNSFYKDSIRRAADLEKRHLAFLDCGTSGGLYGAEHGFSMTIGGKEEIFQKVESVFKLLAASATSYAHVGPVGSGHYIKMIHNGIEYALLEAYAEGFNMLRNGAYKDLDLASISKTWISGSVIRSWLLELGHQVLVHDQVLDSIKGSVGEHGMDGWTVKEAQAFSLPVPVIQESVQIREWSRKTGGDYRTKLIACIRHLMGGHQVQQNICENCQEIL